MPRTCTVCQHAQRADIESALVAGASLRHIASQFGVGYKSVERHADGGHILTSVQSAQTAKQEAQALDVARQLHIINTVTLQVMYASLSDRKTHHLVLQAADRVLRQLELQDKRDKMGELEAELAEIKQLLQANEQDDAWQQ